MRRVRRNVEAPGLLAVLADVFRHRDDPGQAFRVIALGRAHAVLAPFVGRNDSTHHFALLACLRKNPARDVAKRGLAGPPQPLYPAAAGTSPVCKLN